MTSCALLLLLPLLLLLQVGAYLWAASRYLPGCLALEAAHQPLHLQLLLLLPVARGLGSHQT
jgi:hypothetical protein